MKPRGPLALLPAILVLAACTSPQGDAATDTAEPTSDAATASEAEETAPALTTPEDIEYFRGLPDGVGGSTGAPGIGWSSDGSQLYVTTYGSSSCPELPVEITVGETGASVVLSTVGGVVCTMDLAPTTTVIDTPNLPSDIATAVELGDHGTAELPPAADPISYGWVPEASNDENDSSDDGDSDDEAPPESDE